MCRQRAGCNARRWGPAAWWKLPRGMCRQRAGCNPGTAMADGQRAWWKLPRWMCSQRAGCNPGTAKADGQRAWWQLRLECPNNRAMCRQRAGCNAGTAKGDGQRAWWKLPRGNWRVLSVLRVLRVWSLANGRLECLNKRGLCAGTCSKGWRPEGLVEAAARELEGFKRFKGLKPGKRQAWMP